MVRIYLSGTGNAKYCIEKLTKLMDENSKTVPLESDTLIEEIKKINHSHSLSLAISIINHRLKVLQIVQAIQT